MNKLCIIGLGLIGGSIGLAAREKKLAREVWGLVRRKASVREALRRGIVDHATLDPKKAVAGADMIIIATPLGCMEKIASAIRPFVSPGAVVSDVGSCKQCVVASLERIFRPGAFFVGAHPIAGSEQSGMGASRGDLFEKTPCILTPTRKTDRKALGKVRSLWEGLGSRVSLMSPNAHDKIVAAISHLPHVLAVTLVNSLTRAPGKAQKVLPFAGTGFKDSTRIAASPPDIWVDICLANRDEILRALKNYRDDLSLVKMALQKGDAPALRNILLHASMLRQKVL